MLWKEDTGENTRYAVPDDVVDLVYRITCRCLPLDHAWSFSSAVREQLPWLDEEPLSGIHLIHGAESGNGWVRPQDATNEVLHLSHRSRMTLRIPKHRIDDAHRLTSRVLDIEGHSLEVGKATVKRFSTLPTQFARYVVIPEQIDIDDEEAFIDYVVAEMRGIDVRVRKMLCGKTHNIRMPDGALPTRSVMVADLDVEDAVRLQQQGIGAHKQTGCGLFIPHKGIKAVHETTADK
ncbi:MAG TPA: type I-MYXAN CRISPR-associated protein Cas6/Cmx6 [Gammaproteobacteria bacterium]|nr:type I-MYXAN CRISPR-associated protein Cas6/Cmx6 [Gammaproteobacteria bacterium]